MMVRLRERDASAAKEWVDDLGHLNSELSIDASYWIDQRNIASASQTAGNNQAALSEAERKSELIRRCLAVVRDEVEYSDTVAFKVLSDPQLLIGGEWGTGKTHLLCDVTQSRIGRNQVTVLVLAKNFESHILSEICGRIAPGAAVEWVFDRLQDISRELAERAIIIIDGVNEGRRREWRQAIGVLRTLIASRKGMGLVVSCRTPFESTAISSGDLSCLHQIKHEGFDDQAFEAQTAFFQYYKLPLPEVPLLDREFSRPLTLKLICQSLRSLNSEKVAKGFAGIASGQKGMTFVLETFVKGVGEEIEQRFALDRLACWRLLKGNERIPDEKLSGIAPCMAARARSYVSVAEAKKIITAHYPKLAPVRRGKLLEALRISGLLDEDVIWYQSGKRFKSRAVYRLPYQRFSDHLIARHLLGTHLDVSSVQAVERSLSGDSTLAQVFQYSDDQKNTYAEPGLAQALITEFPARVDGKVPDEKRELFFVLPPEARGLSAYREPFVEGLFWRNPAAFTEGTRLVIDHYLNSGRKDWESVIDALAAVATKPNHPYDARRLYNYLARHSMPDRDLTWSEYLRRQYTSPTIRRLLAWAQNLDSALMTESAANELVVLLSLVLTTVRRPDRDIATKALVLIGEKFPKLLFERVVESLGFNDPYLRERMLAAAYGVTMSLVDSEISEKFRPILGSFAGILYRTMFRPRSRHATHHALSRDYALGIIELAVRADCIKLPTSAARYIKAPFAQIRTVFKSGANPDAVVADAIGNAIGMDFSNYTIGRLIPGRDNHDDRHTDYLKVRTQIERRIFDLGYRREWFGSIDEQISSMPDSHKEEHTVDRYGKKYSWIAYFEMLGEREAKGKLPKWRSGERTSDCDIDPSFPKRPPKWAPPIPDLIGDRQGTTEAWVEGGHTPNWKELLVVPEINGSPGEWVLLDGFVRSVDEVCDRKSFAFLRGAFVRSNLVGELEARFVEVKNLGNHGIPEGDEEHYVFAGEVGRRLNYARRLIRLGRFRRQTSVAFDEYVSNAGIGRDHNSKGIRIEIPTTHFAWESYHSSQNAFSGFYLPAPSLIQELRLATRNREIDFRDATGTLATLCRGFGDGWVGDQHNLLYIRADLLREYLAGTRQVLVWMNWGERDWHTKIRDHVAIRDPSRQRIYQAYRNVHRAFAQWQP